MSARTLTSNLSLFIVDMISLTLPFYILFNFQYLANEFHKVDRLETWYILHSIVILAVMYTFSFIQKHYMLRRNYWNETREILNTVILASLFEIVVVEFLKIEYSLVLLSLTWMSVVVLFLFNRALIKFVLKKLKLWHRDTYIIGAGINAAETCQAVRSENNFGFNLKGYIDLDANQADKKILGTKKIEVAYKDLLKFYDPNHFYIIALDAEQSLLREDLLRDLLLNNFKNVYVVPSLRGVPIFRTDISFIFSHEIIILPIQQNISKFLPRIIKRSFDIIFSLSVLLLMSPIFLIICYLIRKDGGSAFYFQDRVGKDGKFFKCYKFRSMCANAEIVLDEYLANNKEAYEEWQFNFKLRNDPRVTKVGRFIRKYSLDELAQLLNILKGDMSVVGPRPLLPNEVERYSKNIVYYKYVKPGLTGLWQVNGRSNVTFEMRVFFDSWYIRNWSLWVDIVIVLKTVKVVLWRDGAY